MNTHQKFLEFNGKKIIFLSVDGTYWIALKPICEALNVSVRRCMDNVKKDPILGPERTIQYLQVENKGIIQGRKMTCIPEQFVYGWIFSLRSDSEELTDYKRTCYKLLYNHFHGTITNRKELLLQRNELDTQIHTIKLSLKEEDEKYKQLQELQNRRKTVSTQLNSIDKELIKQPELFERI
jgi:hypothetical protein